VNRPVRAQRGTPVRRVPTQRRPARLPDRLAAWQKNRIPILVGIVAFTFLVYSRTLGNGFIDFDDPENVIDNVSIRQLDLANIGHYFSSTLQFMYTPLVTLSYAVDYRLAGLDPTMYHFTNLVLHLANVVLVFLVIWELTGRAFLSHVVAAAFALHPMNVDGIAWIATRSNLLATLFSLAAMLVYLRYLKRLQANDQRWWYLAVASGLFVLAALSKSAAVVLPLTLLLVDYYRGRLGWPALWRVLLEKVPFVVIGLVFGIVALTSRIDTVNPHHYTIVDRFFLVCSALVAYLIRLVFPFGLALAHAYPTKNGAFLPWYLYLAPLVLVLIGWALWRLRDSRRLIIFGVGFFVVNVVLSQTVLLIDNYTASRYVYLPYVGLFLILGDLVERGVRLATAHWRTTVACVLVVWLGLFTVVTFIRNGVWKNTESVMSDSIAAEPDVAFVYNSRGIFRYKAGNYDAALQDFDKTIAVDPDFILSLYYRGIIRHLRGDDPGSLKDFDTVVARYPTFAAAYDERGKTKVALNDTAGALADFTTAIQYDAYRVFAYNNRGSLEIDLDNPQAALADLDRALSLDPGYADGYFTRGQAKSKLGDAAGACADWHTAQSLGNTRAPQAVAENHC
jgi:protein O-mannosyl-transferase